MAGMNETEIINDLWFKIHGLDEANRSMKDFMESLKDMKKEADLAEKSASAVIKKWSSFKDIKFNNISGHIYDDRTKSQVTNWARNTHATESHYAADALKGQMGSIDYNAARTAWKATQAELKKQENVERQITNLKTQIKNFLSDELKVSEDIVKEKRKQKERLMTENQRERNERAKERNRASFERNAINSRAEDRKREEFDANKRSREFRNAHPELFATGGQYFNGRYQAANAIGSVGNALGQFGGGGRAAGLFFDTVANFVRSPIAGAAAAISNLATGVLDLGKNATQAFAEIEVIKTQLGVVFSSQTQSDSMFNQISQYAVKSPFGVQQTSELAVLLKQSGVYASDLMDTLKMLGDTAGGNMEKMKRIANNYAQIVSIGKASMLDMRQFAYAGIPIFEAVSKELGVSQQELRKLISDGKVTADIIEKVFKDLTGINGIFENATEKGAKTLKARLQNLADAKQLALSSVGENLVNTGTKYGNDSLILQLVSKTEDFYSWMKEHADVKNIERDVNAIVSSNNRIAALERLLQDAKDSGDKDLIRIVEDELKYQRGIFDVDKKRAIYAESYDIKNERFNRYKEQFGELSETEINAKIAELNNKISEIQKPQLSAAALNSMYGTSPYGGINYHKSNYELTDSERAQLDIYKELIKELTEYKTAINDVNKTIDEERKAALERDLDNAQLLSYEQNQKLSGGKETYASAFDKLYSLWTNDEAYKKQKEKEELELLKEAQEVLKGLKEFTDENGNFDLTQLDYKKFSTLYNDKHAFDFNKRLTVIEGKSESQMTADREVLMKQWSDMSEKIAKELEEDGRDRIFKGITNNGINLTMGTNNKQFFDTFSKVLTQQLNYIDEARNAATTDEVRKHYENMRNNLIASTFQLGLNTNGVNANLLGNDKNQFIPLWKRILSQYTGLTTNGMTSMQSTMENYRNDMAIRNMTADVLSAALKSRGIDSAVSLIGSRGVAKTLKGDTSPTYQVDWALTKKNIQDFALQLSTTTDVISAYKKGLEDELDVYNQLIAASYTQGESQDLNQQKFISSKQVEKLAIGNEQLVNAFGEFFTSDGLEVTFKDGKWFDSENREVQVEQLQLESHLLDFIKSELPRLRQEISKANYQELNNTVLNKMFTSTVSTQLVAKMLASGGSTNTSHFLASNPDYIESGLNSYLNFGKDQVKRYANLQSKGNTDIIALAMQAKNGGLESLEHEIALAGDKEGGELVEKYGLLKNALELYEEALKQTTESADELVNSEEFQELKEFVKNNTRTTALNNRIDELKFRKDNKWRKDEESTPYNDTGFRGVRNRFIENALGYKQTTDIEDLYAQKAKEKGVDKLSFWGKLGVSYGEAGLADTIDALNDFGASLEKIVGDFGKDAWVKPFETMTENLVEGKDALDGMEDVYKGLTADMLSASSAAMQKAGWELVAMGAADRNVAMIAGGLALAAAGGAAAGLGNVLKKTDSDKKDDKVQRLEDLKNDLADLLRQAREDALYYEKTLRHKKALSANDAFTMTSVNDAVITPRGDVVKTDPKDYLIATKTPNALVGGSSVPKVTFNLIDQSTGVRVASQRTNYNPETNTYEITALIKNTVKEVIAGTEGDEAFEARASRQRGRMVIA